MDLLKKLSLVSDNMDVEDGEGLETSIDHCPNKTELKNEPWVTNAKISGGKSIALLKSVITSACERNCKYCAFRAGRNFRRVTFTPDEMANTFINLYQKKVIEGLFLSSGIAGGGIRTQDKIIDTAQILRQRHNFPGYLHLKIMPGAESDQIIELMRWADRVSINLEAPNPERLGMLAPKKNFAEELFSRLKWVEEIRKSKNAYRNWKHKWPSLTTQLVVGPSGESDLELLKTSDYLFRNFNLARIYFMTFKPVIDTPFENLPAENPVRGHRLYQASFLLRDYGFSFEDIEFSQNGRLSLDIDPKKLWADKNFREKPIEINTASREELLRIPGIGPKRVELISKYRTKQKIKAIDELRSLFILPEKIRDYVLVDGKRPARQQKFDF